MNTVNTPSPVSTTQLNFAAIVSDFVKANQKTWEHDRALSVGASEAFDCLRKIWFRKMGKDFGHVEDEVDLDDADGGWGAMERGNILENHFIVPAVRDHLPGAAKLLLAGSQQKTLHVGQNSATPDGLIVGLSKDALSLYGIPDIHSDCIVFEIKSIDPRVGLYEEKTLHRGQTQVQMGIIRDTTAYKPVFGVILYVNASFLDDIKIFVVEYEEGVWKVAQDRAAEIFNVIDPVNLPAEGKIDKSCARCTFQRACALVTTGSIPEDNSKQIDDETREEFGPLIERYRVAKQDAKDADKAFEEMKAEVKAALIDANTRKISVKKAWSASWYPQAGQKRVSMDLIKQALGDDLDAYKVEGDPFDVLRVTFTA